MGRLYNWLKYILGVGRIVLKLVEKLPKPPKGETGVRLNDFRDSESFTNNKEAIKSDQVQKFD